MRGNQDCNPDNFLNLMLFNFCQQHTRTVLLLELNSKLRQILAKCLFPIVAQCHFDLHALAGTKEFSNRVCGLKF